MNCGARINQHDNAAQLSAKKLKGDIEAEAHFAAWHNFPQIT